MMSLAAIEGLVGRQVDRLDRGGLDPDSLYDVATVLWLATQLLVGHLPPPDDTEDADLLRARVAAQLVQGAIVWLQDEGVEGDPRQIAERVRTAARDAAAALAFRRGAPRPAVA